MAPSAAAEQEIRMAADPSIDTVVEEMRQLRTDISRISEALVGVARRQANQAATKVRNAAEDGWTETKGAAAGVAKKIEEQPLTASAIAFGIGMVMAMLLTGRRR
jgi:ElaB/YqjD/DUF883 family membrane-anchored ribosome-binding protein